MDLVDADKCTSLPANYVSLAQLKERWLKKQAENQRELKIEGGSERVVGNYGVVIKEGGSSEKGKEMAKAGSEDVERSKHGRKKKVRMFGKGQMVKNDSGNGKEKDDCEREGDKGNLVVKNGSENGEKKMTRKKKKWWKKYRNGKNNVMELANVADEKVGNGIGVVKSIEGNIDDCGGDGIGIKAGVSEDLNGKNGITSWFKGIEEDLRASVIEVLPKVETKSEISNDRIARQVRSGRKGNTRGRRYCRRIKKVDGANESEVKDEKDNGNNGNTATNSVHRIEKVDGVNENKVKDEKDNGSNGNRTIKSVYRNKRVGGVNESKVKDEKDNGNSSSKDIKSVRRIKKVDGVNESEVKDEKDNGSYGNKTTKSVHRNKKVDGVDESMVKDEKDDGKKRNNSAKFVYRMKTKKSKVLDLKIKVEELKLKDEIVEVHSKIDESKGICKDGFFEKSYVIEEYRAEVELSDSNNIVKSEEKASNIAVKSGKNGDRWGKRNGPNRYEESNERILAEENGERWGKRNGSNRYRKDNGFEGRSQSKKSGDGMMWVKKGERVDANAHKVGSSGRENDAGDVHQRSNSIINEKPTPLRLNYKSK